MRFGGHGRAMQGVCRSAPVMGGKSSGSLMLKISQQDLHCGVRERRLLLDEAV